MTKPIAIEPHVLDPQLATAEGLEQRISDRFRALDKFVAPQIGFPGVWEVQHISYIPPDRRKVRVHCRLQGGSTSAVMHLDFGKHEFEDAKIPDWPYPGKLQRPYVLKP